MMENISLRLSTNCTWNIKNCFHLKSRSPYLWYSPWIVCALWFFSLNILRQASQTRLTFSLKFLGWLWVILSDIYTAFIFVIALNFLRIIFPMAQIYKKTATIYGAVFFLLIIFISDLYTLILDLKNILYRLFHLCLILSH